MNPPVRLVISGDRDVGVLAQHLAPAAILGEAVEARQRIGRDRRPQPLDRVAIVVVMGRLDQDQMERARAVWRCSLRLDLAWMLHARLMSSPATGSLSQKRQWSEALTSARPTTRRVRCGKTTIRGSAHKSNGNYISESKSSGRIGQERTALGKSVNGA